MPSSRSRPWTRRSGGPERLPARTGRGYRLCASSPDARARVRQTRTGSARTRLRSSRVPRHCERRRTCHFPFLFVVVRPRGSARPTFVQRRRRLAEERAALHRIECEIGRTRRTTPQASRGRRRRQSSPPPAGFCLTRERREVYVRARNLRDEPLLPRRFGQQRLPQEQRAPLQLQASLVMAKKVLAMAQSALPTLSRAGRRLFDRLRQLVEERRVHESRLSA